MEKNSLMRVLQWKKGFFIGSFVFYFMFFCGIALFLYRVLKNESAGNCLDDVGILLYVLYLPVFLVQLLESYLWGNPKTGEYILSLPVKRMTVFIVSFIGNILIFTVVYWLLYCLLGVMFSLEKAGALLPLLQKQMLIAYLFTMELYVFVQLFMVNCKNKAVALFMALAVNALKYIFYQYPIGDGYYPYSSRFFIDGGLRESWFYSHMTLAGSRELIEGGASVDSIVIVNGVIMGIYVVFILLSLLRQKEDAVGLFYHRLFRFVIVAIICFILVHYACSVLGFLPGYRAIGHVVFIEILCLIVSITVTYYLERYLTRGGFR